MLMRNEANEKVHSIRQTKSRSENLSDDKNFSFNFSYNFEQTMFFMAEKF